MAAIHTWSAMRENARRYHVYALFCQDEDGPGYVKFGRSMRIGSRLSQLRTSCPIPARYFAIVDVGPEHKMYMLEDALHRHFSDRRVTGEWYRFDFKSEEDKRAFNDGCRKVFVECLGRNAPGWTKMSIAALDREAKARRQDFLKSRHRKKIEQKANREAAQKRAWRELDNFGI